MLLETTATFPFGRPAAASEAGAETTVALLEGVWRAPVGIAFVDRELRFVQVNDAFARLSGRPASMLAGLTAREVFGEGDLLARAEQRLRAVIASGQPAVDVTASSTTSSGMRAWRTSLYPVFAASGRVRGVCAVVDETTHLHEREAALEHTRAAAEVAARRASLLYRLTAALSAAATSDDVAAAIAEHVRAAAGAEVASVRVLAPEGLVRVATDGARAAGSLLPRVVRPDAPAPAAEALRERRGIWIESPEAYAARYPRAAELQRQEGYETWTFLPLAVGGHVLGALSLMFRRPHAFDLEERAFLLGLSQQCAQALARARALDAEHEALGEARRAADGLRALQAVTAALARARTPQDVAKVFVEGATFVLGAEVAAVFFHDRARGAATLRAQHGATADEIARHAQVPIDGPHPAAVTIRTGEARWLESWEEVVAAHPDLARERDMGAVVLVPLRGHDEVLGAAGMYFTRPRRFDQPTREVVTTIAEQCGLALERAVLLDRERTLRAEAERDRSLLDGIFENAPLGIGLLDAGLRFVRVNPMLARMNGAPPEAHVGRLPPEIIEGLAWEEQAGALREVVETGTPRVDAPVRALGADGTERHYLEAWYPVRAGGEQVGIGLIVRDVTAERDAEEFQRNVLGIVGHDVRSPLGAIVTAAHLLARDAALGEPRARLVERIRAGAVRIERVVAVLLDYAQARRERGIPVRARPCDLAVVCREVAAECEAAHPGRTVRCSGEASAPGEWDPDRLGQVLANLVSNALDYSAPGSPVDVSWARRDGEVEVVVANEGAPIPPETLARIFEPFRRGRRELAGGEGLGLGLFIARAIVVAHGGTIAVRSDARGTAFTIRMPRAAPPPASSDGEAIPSPGLAHAP